MFHPSMSRSHRAKGSKAKNIFQVTVLLAVVIWLLYQTKHSYDRKTKYVGTDYIKLAKQNTDIQLGRKINVGSGDGIIMDATRKNSGKTTETGEIGEGTDVFNQNNEENAKEFKHEGEKSGEGSGREETQQEQKSNVDNKGDPNDTGEASTEGMQEVLKLPSQRIAGSFDQNENQNAVTSSSEVNGLPKDDTTTADGSNGTDGEKVTSEEATLNASKQTESQENTGNGSETDKTGGKPSDDATPVMQEPSTSSVSDDQSNQDSSEAKDIHEGGTIETQENSGSGAEITINNTAEEASTNATSDVESQISSALHMEFTSNSSTEASGTDKSSVDETANLPKSAKESNVVMPDSNGVPGTEEGESQAARTTEIQATGSDSTEAVDADSISHGESADSSNSSEENSSVMSDNNGVPKEEEVQTQMEHVSNEKTDNNSSEDVTTDARYDGEVSEKEAVQPQGVNASDAEVTTNVTVENENDPKPSEVAVSSSLDTKDVNSELAANTEDIVVGETQSQASNDAENTSKNSEEEEKSEKSSESADKQADQNNEQNNSDLPKNETPSEQAASNEDNASMAEQQSTDATASDSNNNNDLSSMNVTAEGQESSTSSESSGSDEYQKRSAEL